MLGTTIVLALLLAPAGELLDPFTARSGDDPPAQPRRASDPDLHNPFEPTTREPRPDPELQNHFEPAASEPRKPAARGELIDPFQATRGRSGELTRAASSELKNPFAPRPPATPRQAPARRR